MVNFSIERIKISSGPFTGKTAFFFMEPPQDEPYHNDEWLWYQIRPADKRLHNEWVLEIKRWKLGQNPVTRTSVTKDWGHLYGQEGNGVSFEDALAEMVLHSDKFVSSVRPRTHEIFEDQKKAYLADKAKGYAI